MTSPTVYTKTVDQSATHYSEHVMPDAFDGKYSEHDKAMMQQIIDWMNRHKKSRRWLAVATRIPPGTFGLLMSGGYKGHVTPRLKKTLDTIRHVDARSSLSESPFIDTVVSRTVFSVCKRARKHKSFGIVSASVGTGKTRALKEYALQNANTLFIEADPQMSAGALLDDIVEYLQMPVLPGYYTRERKFRLVVEQLKRTPSLLILDEAETVNPKTLEHVRRLRDKAGLGVVLAGTTKLYSLISPKGGQFDQIRSRVCVWPKPINHVTTEDAEAVITASFPDFDDIDRSVFNAFWAHSQGSMRMLVEDLIPAVRDYGLKKYDTLTADLVHAVAKDVLNIDLT